MFRIKTFFMLFNLWLYILYSFEVSLDQPCMISHALQLQISIDALKSQPTKMNWLCLTKRMVISFSSLSCLWFFQPKISIINIIKEAVEWILGRDQLSWKSKRRRYNIFCIYLVQIILCEPERWKICAPLFSMNWSVLRQSALLQQKIFGTVSSFGAWFFDCLSLMNLN